MQLNRTLPPLRALRSFESAARLRSFARAAEELHVTPAAISQQVKSLETWLGCDVFRRARSGLELTQQGRTLLPALKGAFDMIQTATDDLRGPGTGTQLTLAVQPSFAMRWLAPRLPDFALRHPWIDLNILSVTPTMATLYEGCDMAIRAYEHDPQYHFEPIATADMVPMLHPRLLKRGSLKQPDELLRFRLLHSTVSPEDWPRWFRETRKPGEREPPSELMARGHQFDSHVVAMEAASAGLGVVLGRLSMSEDLLRRRELVIPFPRPIPSNITWYLVYPRAELQPKCEAFRDWIKTQATN